MQADITSATGWCSEESRNFLWRRCQFFVQGWRLCGIGSVVRSSCSADLTFRWIHVHFTTLVVSKFFERQLTSLKHFVVRTTKEFQLFREIGVWTCPDFPSDIHYVDFRRTCLLHPRALRSLNSTPRRRIAGNFRHSWHSHLSFEMSLILIRTRDEIPLLLTPEVLHNPKILLNRSFLPEKVESQRQPLTDGKSRYGWQMNCWVSSWNETLEKLVYGRWIEL